MRYNSGKGDLEIKTLCLELRSRIFELYLWKNPDRTRNTWFNQIWDRKEFIRHKRTQRDWSDGDVLLSDAHPQVTD